MNIYYPSSICIVESKAPYLMTLSLLLRYTPKKIVFGDLKLVRPFLSQTLSNDVRVDCASALSFSAISR